MSRGKPAKIASNNKKDKPVKYVKKYYHVLRKSGAFGLKYKFVPEEVE